jgi:hypothetical protein
MKTVVSTLLAFFFTVALFAQNFVADEFIVEYVAGTTNTQQQVVRDLFGITNTTDIGENIELWADIDFPLSVTEDGETTIIDDVEVLLYYINIQEGHQDNASAIINNGDLEYILTLIDDGTIYPNGTFDPLPFCDDSLNENLIGPELPPFANQNAVKIIIVDQYISSGRNVVEIGINDYQSFPYGGSHGHKVKSVIENQLIQANVNDYTFYTVALFDETGTANYSRILMILNQLSTQNELNIDNAIMNFSANMIINESDTDLVLWDNWNAFLNDHDILLSSSAGNEGIYSNTIFPGCAGWSNEITVAGTRGCFQQPWNFSNRNSTHFEIATEAKNILVHDGENYRLVNGTSYSSAFVTGAAAQLAARCQIFDPLAIKNQLLDYADVNPNLVNLVNQGRTLNVAQALQTWGNCGGTGGIGTGGIGGGGIFPLQSNNPTSPLTLSTTPNPFANTALVTIQLPTAGDVTISMYNMIGQRVHEEFISNQQELVELEWPTPAKLARGTYLLRVQAGEAVEQMMIIKQ